MVSLSISEATFSRLQAHALPLIDDADSVICRLLDAYESTSSLSLGQKTTRSEYVADSQTPLHFQGLSAPDLRHTKILRVRIGQQSLPPDQANWNGVLVEMVKRVAQVVASYDELRKYVAANTFDGRKEDDGYRYVQEIDVSIQGQDANSAWRTAAQIARFTKIELSIDFFWRSKEGAAYPGAMGELTA